jgi:hypothetical protein
MADLRALLRRLATPMSAALIFCGIGLTCAVGVISINRMLSQRPPPVVAALPSPPSGSSPTPSRTSATASPTPASTASCTSAPMAHGHLGGLVVSSAATVLLATDSSTVSVTVPVGAQVDGQPGDLHAHLPGAAGQTQHLTGTVVRDVAICAVAPGGVMQVGIGAGATVDGTAVASAGGIEAADVHFTSGGGGNGGG